jgi:hypothetical protein
MTVLGHTARGPRLTPLAAAILALAIALPGGGLIGLIAWVWG